MARLLRVGGGRVQAYKLGVPEGCVLEVDLLAELVTGALGGERFEGHEDAFIERALARSKVVV